MIYKGKAHIDTYIFGKLTDTNCIEPHILIVDKPTYENIKMITKSNAVIFTEKLAPYSHETLLFQDYFIPSISNVNSEILNSIGSFITLYCKDGIGNIYLKELNDLPPIKSKKMNCAFTSTISGMKFCFDLGASIVATRGEFMYFQSTNLIPTEAITNPKESKRLEEKFNGIIKYGANNFTSFIYRFSDLTDDFLEIFKSKKQNKFSSGNYNLGNRGTYRLINSHLQLFLFEINLVSKISNSYNNISVVLPFIRTLKEAQKANDLVRRKFFGKVGCMIEVPSIIFKSKEINSLFDFFIIGCSDLLQLTQGCDRNEFDYDTDTFSFIADYLQIYFLNNINVSKPVFVTSKKIYLLLKDKHTNIQLLNKI